MIKKNGLQWLFYLVWSIGLVLILLGLSQLNAVWHEKYYEFSQINVFILLQTAIYFFIGIYLSILFVTNGRFASTIPHLFFVFVPVAAYNFLSLPAVNIFLYNDLAHLISSLVCGLVTFPILRSALTK